MFIHITFLCIPDHFSEFCLNHSCRSLLHLQLQMSLFLCSSHNITFKCLKLEGETLCTKRTALTLCCRITHEETLNNLHSRTISNLYILLNFIVQIISFTFEFSVKHLIIYIMYFTCAHILDCSQLAFIMHVLRCDFCLYSGSYAISCQIHLFYLHSVRLQSCYQFYFHPVHFSILKLSNAIRVNQSRAMN